MSETSTKGELADHEDERGDASAEGDAAAEESGSDAEDAAAKPESEKPEGSEGKAKRTAAEEEGETDDVVASPAKPEVPLLRPSWAFLAVVTVVTLAADLGSKIWAESRFPKLSDRMNVIGDVVLFRLVKNTGGAWGILGKESPALRISFFIAISIVAVIFILSLYRKTSRDQRALTWGLPLVLGGALGNLVDRIRYGMVVDFIEVHIGSYQHPTFNIADVAIVAGVILMAIDMFTPRRRNRRAAKTESVKVPA